MVDIDTIKRIIEQVFSPAINFKAPYAKVMLTQAAAEIAHECVKPGPEIDNTGKHLVVGGQLDGEWIGGTSDTSGIAFFVPMQRAFDFSESGSQPTIASREKYTRRCINSGDEHWSLWAPDTLTEPEVFAKLLKGYKP